MQFLIAVFVFGATVSALEAIIDKNKTDVLIASSFTGAAVILVLAHYW